MQALRLTEIWIYPIKSLGGIRFKQANVFEKGLQYDRRWMLVDEAGKFLTQRVHPIMALFKVSIEGDTLTITHTQIQQSHSVSLHPQLIQQSQPVTIWDDTVLAYEVSETSSQWFSALLGIKCKLVYFPEENNRAVDRRYATTENVSLADGYPFLIIGQASLDDLNSRLEKVVSMNRFRPNFVFTGGNPFEEDAWKEFSIGANRFVGVKPCSRCVLITVDQNTAQKSDEPLRTLSTYRKKDNKIYFGQNLLALNHTVVREGDLITLET
ncbi:MOSC domain-containing protein [Chryseotalea sanaruensis]|uniref:MOSC domain-containing protein n=1 Tax=Chryseotalea sanaruensis TaxID=2482724 RepID=A0A401UFJ7_9BACT|nr:MOSC N-terminal beta barrel domain-containing protein [Chryseotalea sanaruensis]GCC53642.1 MOSC domain-containing protein [Chryseotalea sanaruensis]